MRGPRRRLRRRHQLRPHQDGHTLAMLGALADGFGGIVRAAKMVPVPQNSAAREKLATRVNPLPAALLEPSKGKFSLICPPDDLALCGGLEKSGRILAESLKVLLMVRALYASTRTKMATRGHSGIRCHHGRRSSGAWSRHAALRGFIS